MSFPKLEYVEKQRNAWGIIPTGGRVSFEVSACTFLKKRSKSVPSTDREKKRPRRALKRMIYSSLINSLESS